MGYETRLIIGQQTDRSNCEKDNELFYFQEFARIDLCKLYRDYSFSRFNYYNQDTAMKQGTACSYFYDGDTSVIEDSYGIKMKSIDASIVLSLLKEGDVDSRRVKWALALLESMLESTSDLQVLLFNH